MAKKKKSKPKIKITFETAKGLSEDEVQLRLNKAFDILFTITSGGREGGVR